MDLATLGIAVDSREVVDASQDLDRISAAAKKAEDATAGFGKRAEDAGRRAAAANDNVARSASKVTAAYDKWHAVARRVATAVGAIAGTFAVAALTRYADAWSDMQSRVGAAIKDMEAAPAMMQRIVDIANASYSPLSQTVEIYGRNVAVLSALGRTATEAADFTEALNHALVTTATKGQDADVVLNALSRSIAIGGLRSMEFETIMSRSPRVLEAIASELGTNVTQLRSFAQQGKVTGDVIVNALINNLEALRAEAGEMPATIGDAFTRLRTNLTAFIGQMDQATGASQRLSSAIMLVADNIDVIARVVAVAGVALATYFAPTILAGIASGLVTIGTVGVAAMRAIAVAVAANPIGALVVAITTAVTAFYLFRDEIKQAIGVDFVAIIEGAINTVIGVFVGGYEAIKAEWSNLPAVLGDLGIRASNALMAGIQEGINRAMQAIRDLYAWVNPIAGIAKIAGFELPQSRGIQIDPIKNPYEGAAAASGANIAGIFDDAMSRDYIGALKEIAFGTRSAEEATNDMAAAMTAANAAMDKTGGGGGAADKAAKAVKGVADAAKDAAQAALDFGKDLVKGFVSDLRSGLEQGKGFWKSFGDAAMNVLDKIVDKLLNDVIDAIFRVNQAGRSGNGSGGGLLGMLGGLFGGGGGFTNFEHAWTAAVPGLWAKGGAFPNGISGFSNTVVDRATPFMFAKGAGIMGEAGPEAIMPLKRGPDGKLGVSAANQARGVVVNIQNYGSSKDFEVQQIGPDEVRIIARDEVANGIIGYDREVLPARVNQIANDPHARG